MSTKIGTYTGGRTSSSGTYAPGTRKKQTDDAPARNTATRPRGAEARINGGGNKIDIGRIANAAGRSPEQRQRITKKGAK